MNSKLLIAILLVVGSVPLAGLPTVSAKHFSVGAQDAAGVQPSERPGSASVPTTSELWEAGTTREGCAQWTGDAENAADEAGQILTADPFCGRLWYNVGVEGDDAGDFEFQSPEDQTYSGNPYDLSFDGMITTNAGGFSTVSCAPFWCVGASSEAFQDLAAQAGISDDYDGFETGAGGATGGQQYTAKVVLPNAGTVVSEQLGSHQANGWSAQVGFMTLMAFLQIPEQPVDLDGDGVADLDADGRVNQTELNALVGDAKAEHGLHPLAASAVCAFTPDADISISAPAAQFCEVIFEYKDESDDVSNGGHFDSYTDACGSPTYVCGANQPGWYASMVTTPTTGDGFVYGDQGQDSTTDYDIWHYVVAPTGQECAGMEPGFLTDPDASDQPADMAYLAHDLDVHDHATSPAGTDAVVNARNMYNAIGDNGIDTAIDAANTALDEADQAIEDTDLPPEAQDAADTAIEAANDGLGTAVDASYIALKDRTAEPNAIDPATGEFLDTSQSAAGVQADEDMTPLIRSVDDPGPCTAFQEATGETPETVDPWVDYIDTWAWQDHGGLVGTIPIHADQGADSHKDANNADTPTAYWTSGWLGMYTDKDDDGLYGPSPNDNDQWKEWQERGAYPMFWDMWVEKNDQGQWEPKGGCIPTFGSQTGLADLMEEAGYGPRTGLIQVVYLQEPTVLRNTLKGVTHTQLVGDNAYVFMSQAMKALLEADDPKVVLALEEALDKLPDDLGDFPLHDVNPHTNTSRIKFPGKQVSASDFNSQCPGDDIGGYTNAWTYYHQCATGCEGDTIVTSYVFDVASGDGTLGGGSFKVFSAEGTAGFNFEDPQAGYDGFLELNQWFDVDPFDGDPERNAQASSAPPTG